MTDPFPTVTRIANDGTSEVITRPNAVEQIERRRERANHIRHLVDAGTSTVVIARDMGISRARVYHLLAYADLADRLEPDAVTELEPRAPDQEGGRTGRIRTRKR